MADLPGRMFHGNEPVENQRDAADICPEGTHGITDDQAQKKANPLGGLAYLKANAINPRSTALLTEFGLK